MKEKCLVRVVERCIADDCFEDIDLILDTEKTPSNEEFANYANEACCDIFTNRIKDISTTVTILKESTFKKLRDSFLNVSEFDATTTRNYKFSYFSKWCEKNLPAEWNEFSEFIGSDINYFNNYNAGYCFSSFEKKFDSNFDEWEYEEETKAASN